MKIFDGKVGNIRIYKHNLTPEEICDIYYFGRVDYLPWFKRLLFWFGETLRWLIRGW